MKKNNVLGLFAAAALTLLAGCSSPMPADPCAPGGLCAPATANTSDHPRAADLGAALPGPASSAAVRAAPRAAPIRIALLLPLRSEALAGPAEAVRAGFMAAHERDKDNIEVAVTATGNGTAARETLDAYAAAAAASDIVVGPLARPEVGAIAASGMVSKPTIALNHPPTDTRVPAAMLVMGLSIEDEARQVARWAAGDRPGQGALIVSGTSAWQKRIATAYIAECKRLGMHVETVDIPATNGYLSESAIRELKTRIDTEPPAMMLAALDADQLRQVRASIGTDLPVYGTSSVNPGSAPGGAVAELDGVHLLDMPWQVQSDHPTVGLYPRAPGERPTLDLDRLYALGIDAYRVAREIAQKRTEFQMDGVTGRLKISYGKGAASFERQLPGVSYQNGAFLLVEPVR